MPVLRMRLAPRRAAPFILVESFDSTVLVVSGEPWPCNTVVDRSWKRRRGYSWDGAEQVNLEPLDAARVSPALNGKPITAGAVGYSCLPC